ncbi:MAG TPA: tetratricopeptide repeat protein, partial [Armatimonadota bacterium]|nr:tetratricopeptide repeat protein [Armatimonadota bacterium]
MEDKQFGHTERDEARFDERMRRNSATPEEEKREPTAYERAQIGDCLCDEGRVEDAIIHYRKAVKMEGNNAHYRERLGDAYAYSEESVKAVGEYRRALKLNPRRAEPHFGLAEVYRRYGKLNAAVASYRKAVQYNPLNPFYRYKLGDALAQIG